MIKTTLAAEHQKSEEAQTRSTWPSPSWPATQLPAMLFLSRFCHPLLMSTSIHWLLDVVIFAWRCHLWLQWCRTWNFKINFVHFPPCVPISFSKVNSSWLSFCCNDYQWFVTNLIHASFLRVNHINMVIFTLIINLSSVCFAPNLVDTSS